MGDADGPTDESDDSRNDPGTDSPVDDNRSADDHDESETDAGADDDTRKASNGTADSSGSERPDDGGESTADTGEPTSRAQERRKTVTRDELEALEEDLEAFEAEIEDRTVHRESLESDLKRYVRRRLRRGHARGWGPYLVLLYGTVMTLGGFYFLRGIWAILAMLVIWLSTLGLYTLMILVGITLTVSGVPRRLVDRVRRLR